MLASIIFYAERQLIIDSLEILTLAIKSSVANREACCGAGDVQRAPEMKTQQIVSSRDSLVLRLIERLHNITDEEVFVAIELVLSSFIDYADL